MRESHVFGNLALIQPSFFARRNQPLEDRIVLNLKGRRPRFARPASFGFSRLTHISSVGNALPNPLIRDRLERDVIWGGCSGKWIL